MLDQGLCGVWRGRGDVQPNCVDRKVLDACWQRPKVNETWNVQELTHLSKTEISPSTGKYRGHLRA